MRIVDPVGRRRETYRNTWVADLTDLKHPSGTLELAIVMPARHEVEVHQLRVFAMSEGAEIPTPVLRSMLWDVTVQALFGDVFVQTWEPLIVLLEPWPQPARLLAGYNARFSLRVPKPLELDKLRFAVDYRSFWP